MGSDACIKCGPEVRFDERGVPHAARVDAKPYRIPDWLPYEDRIDLLEENVELGINSDEMQQIAVRLRALALQQTRLQDPGALEPTHHDLGQTILKYVQSGGYRPDPPGEWYQGPLYTVRYAGNCNDLSVLFAVLARINGLEANIYWVEQRDLRDRFGRAPARDHVLSGVRTPSGDLCWADATVVGAAYCENPYRAHRQSRQAAAFQGF